MLCCFALFVCLTLLASFFLLISHLKTCKCIHVVHVYVHIVFMLRHFSATCFYMYMYMYMYINFCWYTNSVQSPVKYTVHNNVYLSLRNVMGPLLYGVIDHQRCMLQYCMYCTVCGCVHRQSFSLSLPLLTQVHGAMGHRVARRCSTLWLHLH